MNSLWARTNAFVTNVMIIAAAMAICTAGTDYLTEPRLPKMSVEMLRIDHLLLTRDAQDRVQLALKLDADLRPYWTWNTKLIFAFIQIEYVTATNVVNQVSLWDSIIQDAARANLHFTMKQEYPFLDESGSLRGTPLNVTLTWNVVPRVGSLRTFSRSVDVGPLPQEYVDKSTAWGDWLGGKPSKKITLPKQ